MDRGKQNPTLSIRNFGPIERVDLAFGDLTVLVGPQGAGKSLALQWLKASVDSWEIGRSLREAGFDLRAANANDVVDLVFGEGMHQALQSKTKVELTGNSVRLDSIKGKGGFVQPRMFFIPAHRALLLSEGWPAPFAKLSSGTPVVVRLFSQALYDQLSRPRVETLFPQNRVLVKDIRERIDASVFHGGTVELQKDALRRRLELRYGETTGLPFMTWTAGQREFTPLLLGLYSVLPPRKQTKIVGLDWVVIEEPELGLHPRAIATVMILVMDLLWRGYRVVLSTHSPLVLDFVWALRHFKHPKARIKDLADALELSSQAIKKLRAAVEGDLRVYYLAHDSQNRVKSQDISELRPDAESIGESNWGGLTQFGTSLSEAVARIPEDES